MEALFTVNNLWILVATCFVFIMHLGFASLEAGFVQRKNVVNILFKNSMIICIGLLTYYLIGYNLMYPGDAWAIGGWLGELRPNGLGCGCRGRLRRGRRRGGHLHRLLRFHLPGHVCRHLRHHRFRCRGRADQTGSLPYSSLRSLSLFPTPSAGPGSGELAGWIEMGFYDFAGSTLVHAAGGFAALAAIILLGARKGKYRKDGRITAIPGHSMPLAAIGVFLLWFGWYGFNGGSVLSADPNGVSLVFVTTSLAAAAGGVAAFFMAYFMFRSYDLSMVLNGILGGLVGITAGADVVTGSSAILIGLIAGVIIPLSIVFFDKTLRLDDPVGATSVHGVCGIWGTLAVGIFSTNPDHGFVTQFVGVAAIGAFSFATSFGIMITLKAVMGIRVDEEEEIKGLDLGEHDMHAYTLSKEDGVFQLTSEN